MRALGIKDEEEACLRYMARLSRPQVYDPDSPTFGLSQWEYDLCQAIHESASAAAELLRKHDALVYRHCAEVPDYWAELPEDKTPRGRVLCPSEACETMSDGGQVAVRTMGEAARRDGVDIRTGHRAQRLVVRDGAVVGVVASTPDGMSHRFRARKAVIFATGGFTHNPELCRNFLNVPVYGGCAATTNEGDLVAIASAVGAQLRNINYAWMCPVPLEKAITADPGMSGMFSVAGDSMVFVNKSGRRVVNEKLQYNELAQAFFRWDPAAAEYPNLVLAQVWDQRSQDHSASTEYGRLIVPPGTDDSHVIKGETLEELTQGIDERLARYASRTGGLRLAPEFVATLQHMLRRFNAMAREGVDRDFHRGERAVQLLFNGLVKEEPGRANPTLEDCGLVVGG
jgi:3-oxosteroid 1-dehydrogenase